VAGSPLVADGGAFWIDSFTFETEPGMLCAARLLVPKSAGPKPPLLFVNTDSLRSAATNARRRCFLLASGLAGAWVWLELA
jgi:hypothetical protein